MEIYLRKLAAALAEAGYRVRVVTRFAQRQPADVRGMHTGHEEARSYRDGSVDIDVIAPTALLRPLLAPVYRLHFRLPHLAARLLHAAHGRSLRRALADADVVHFSGNGRELLGFGVAREAARRGIPLIITPHTHADAWGDGPIDFDLYRKAKAVVALTEDERSRLCSAGIPASAVRIVPHGVSVRGGGDGMAFRLRHGLADHPVVLFLGRKTPDKGFDLLLEAASHLWREVPNARIVLAGTEGPVRPLPAAAADARVVQLGRIDDAEREDAYAACDVFCLPSAAEAFGLVVLEAWGYGKAVVTSDIPTLRERLRQGGGITAPLHPDALAHALARVLTNEGLRNVLGQEGRALAATATWAATASVMGEIYEATRAD